MKEDNKVYDNAKIRYSLFLAFYVESNSRWAEKFNTSLRKCHDKVDDPSRFLTE